MRNRMIKFVFILLAIVVTSPMAKAYPPDNAAVLYYKAIMMVDVSGDMSRMMGKLRKNESELNDDMRECVLKNKSVIDCVLDASEVSKCDWGVDKSKGFNFELPYLSKMRKLAYLICADAFVLAEKGDYEAAMDRYICIYKMARHINQNNVVCNLVAVSFNGVANQGVMCLLSDMEVDVDNLVMVKDKLSMIEGMEFLVKPAFEFEKEIVLMTLTMEKKNDFILCMDTDNEYLKKKILEADEAFLAKNREYWNKVMDVVESSFDLPYIEAFERLNDLEKQVNSKQAKADTPLVAACFPSWDKVYSLNIRWQSGYNAVKAAIEVYMVKAKTGKLPEELPAGLPVDMFSGRAFEYKKTKDGFTLRCAGEDLSQKKTYEYEFKVK